MEIDHAQLEADWKSLLTAQETDSAEKRPGKCSPNRAASQA